MRFKYRITKYDPSKRNHKGHFIAKDWTSISDIGKSFNGQILTHSEYERIEGTYLDCIAAFLSESQIETLGIDKLEMQADQYSFKIGQDLQANKILDISRLALRERLWCQLRNPRRAYLHFGYDYYIYIGVSRPCHSAIARATNLGLFVEPFWSPYLKHIPEHA